MFIHFPFRFIKKTLKKYYFSSFSKDEIEVFIERIAAASSMNSTKSTKSTDTEINNLKVNISVSSFFEI